MIDLYQYKVAWCPICNQGWVEIAKDTSSKELFLFCEECESEWDDPLNIKKDTSTRDKYGLVEVPSLAEIQDKKWYEYIIKDSNAYDARILEISQLTEDQIQAQYKKWGIENPISRLLYFVTIEVNKILLKGLGTSERDWNYSLINKEIRILISFENAGTIKKCNFQFKGILQKEDNIYLAIGDVIEIDESGRSFLLDCGVIITRALRANFKNIEVGDRVLIESIEFSLCNIEFEK
ncbi:hypothetical protein MSSIH_1697 [Methanosarcina siciliae HI350]|uniref:Uncharacterized protein n=1 Tax=Methanosarcina siciliae HI350 TaxID=1434119 RepID=A0A0E3PD58_9EURY|nr:hypothetical protein [Methanosarcina siciliae]AKB32387.1 hypothetical protein MSSIH_1697 [Methanosarcina siciliae HI350]